MSLFYSQRFSNWALAILIVVNVVVLSFLWFNQQMGNPRKGGPPKVDHFLERQLDLSSEQSQQLKTLRQAHFKRTRSIHEKIRRNKEALIDAFTSTSRDTSEAIQIANQIGELQSNLEKELVSHYQSIANICTPEQKEKLGAVFREAMRKRPHRKRRRH